MPITSLQTITDTPQGPIASPPPPYQLHQPPIPSTLFSPHYPIATASNENLRTRPGRVEPSYPTANPPIYNTLGSSPIISTTPGSPAPRKLNSGLKALFQAHTPLSSQGRYASNMRPASPASIYENEPLRPMSSIPPELEASSNRSSQHSFHSESARRSYMAISELAGDLDNTSHLPKQHISHHPSHYRLGGSAQPNELDGNSVTMKVGHLSFIDSRQ